ncbi:MULTISPECIES: hypothetical protein [unclassified Frankia]|uniref:hypothetical protein n=1 Tax=unclassified Frankia TaxID=2632575 RepID=UPI002AD5325F|nr:MULTISPECIES: hypothetical protein [unclassified Frankia]
MHADGIRASLRFPMVIGFGGRILGEKIVTAAGLTDAETYQLLRGHAIECFGLSWLGFTA